jgi:hypothetical protein
VITSHEVDQVFGAIADAKSEIQPVEKGKENPFYQSHYMDLDGIKDVVDPVLDKHALVITQWPDTTLSGEAGLTTHVFHKESKQFVYATSPLSLTKKDPQAQGSAMTYLKRYAYVAILGIKGVDPDDDGNVASQPDRAVTAKGAKAEDGKASRASTGQRGELERAATEKGWSKAKLTKWYHDSFGKDYKTDNDEANLAKALASIILKDDQ